ncbi:ASKHA domain-containing protein [Halomonas lysinitropha]|uniref:2Fe-2S iron-sulfur cluster binding domain protein n=1 Tax=Halomonas lysinitropha TaxID=2607506 RepID=A0A5K1I1T1_9GAMM|nr:ASKHA domain-containing protein [Halomonas lysinitropha]VVZ94040.1 2Fe-2S iron-sulfur cluster binding domain protein [Halomonas lysinitropha]
MPDADDALVVFTPSGRRGRFPVGTPVLEAARALGVDIDSVCGGRGLCGRCQVDLCEGRFSKHGVESWPDHLTAKSPTEQAWETRRGPLRDGRRLSCSTQLLGDAVIDVPSSSQVHRQIVRKRAEVLDIELDPIVRLYYVEVQEPDMHVPASDLRRLKDALAYDWNLVELENDIRVVQQLQAALRQGGWGVTVAVYDDRRIIGVWSGFQEQIYGMAVDVGSTTIAAHLCNLQTGVVVASSGRMNPQIRFGEDLMSRVSYIMMNPGGELAMTRSVRDALNELTVELAAEADVHVDAILEATFVGNPIMQSLVFGINPVELGGAPFALATDEAIDGLWATEMDLVIHPSARVYGLPCIAGHVGADTAGMILSETPYLGEELMLLVDVGTNAEIVLGNRHRLLACSSPTGPAFEGAQISGGQRAASGAIERVRIDPLTLEPRYKVIGCEQWSDEAGFEEGVAPYGVTGICGSGIIEVIAEMYLAGIISQDGVVQGGLSSRSGRVVAEGRTFSYVLHRDDSRTLAITQNDIRAIQLAKAALYAGIRLLMEQFGTERVDRIRLAGAFGAHIDVKYAMILGLIPDCDLDYVTSAGNAAGTGARIALLSRKARREIEEVVRRVEKIETATEPRFQEHFVSAMAIPHKSDPFPLLREHVSLPLGVPAEHHARRTSRRRRAPSSLSP